MQISTKASNDPLLYCTFKMSSYQSMVKSQRCPVPSVSSSQLLKQKIRHRDPLPDVSVILIFHDERFFHIWQICKGLVAFKIFVFEDFLHSSSVQKLNQGRPLITKTQISFSSRPLKFSHILCGE